MTSLAASSSCVRAAPPTELFGFFDVSHIAQPGTYTWRELRYTCQSLGLPTYSFDTGLKRRQMPDYIKENISEYGIKMTGVRDILEARFLEDEFSEATNLHSVEYQAQCLVESLKLLEEQKLTFSSIQATRILFYFYEDSDLKGMKFDVKVLNNMLRIMGLICASKELDHHFRSALLTSTVKNRLQLFEFLHLLPKFRKREDEMERLGESCGQLGPSGTRKKEKSAYPYQMDSFEMILTTPDIRTIEKLDYEHDRQKFLFLDLFESSDVINDLFKENSSKPNFAKSTMLTEIEESLKRENRVESRLLKLDLENGRSAITQTRCGHVRSTALSAPPSRLSTHLGSKGMQETGPGTSKWVKLQNVLRFTRRASRIPSTSSSNQASSSVPVKYQRCQFPPIVSKNEETDHFEKMSELKFKLTFMQ